MVEEDGNDLEEEEEEEEDDEDEEEEEDEDDDEEEEEEDVRRTRHPGYNRGINPPNTRVTATKADVRRV